MGYICEKAGGKASNGYGRLLNIEPKKIHERSGIILGSPEDVDEVEALYAEFKKN